MNNYVNPLIVILREGGEPSGTTHVILREGGGPSGTPVPSTSIQFRISPLSSTENASAHWIAAFAAMTMAGI